MKPPPELPTLFLDRNLGKNIVSARLRAEGVAVEVHDDHFAIDAPDEEWIRSVAGRGWIAVTRDRNIRYRTHEMNSIRDSAARDLLPGNWTSRQGQVISMAVALAAAKRERRERAAARTSRSGGLAAKAGEEEVGGDRLDHGRRLRSVDGGGAQGHVLEGLDEDAAEAELRNEPFPDANGVLETRAPEKPKRAAHERRLAPDPGRQRAVRGDPAARPSFVCFQLLHIDAGLTP